MTQTIRRRLTSDVSAPTRWPALDGVRGVALIAVVVYHFLRAVLEAGDGQDGELSWPLWTFMGTARLGLDAFFVLSGMLVVESWRSVRRHAPTTRAAIGEFWRRRARRIFPAYWLSLAVLAPWLAPELFRSLGGLLKLFLFVGLQQDVIADLPDQVNTVYWSLTTEFHFYLLVPVVAWLMLRSRRGMVLAAAIALSVAWWAGLRGNMAPSFIFGRLDQFLIGAIIGDLLRRERSAPVGWLLRRLSAPPAGLILTGALLAIGTWHGSRLWAAPLTPFDYLLHPLAGLILAGLFVRLTACPQQQHPLSHPILRFAGLISYSVYLWHYPLQRKGLALFGASAGETVPTVVLLAAGALIMAATLAVGVMSYLVAERPFLRRRAVHDSRPKAPAARGWTAPEPVLATRQAVA